MKNLDKNTIKTIIFYLIISVFFCIATAIQPIFWRKLIDNFNSINSQFLIKYSFLYLMLYLISNFLAYCGNLLQWRFGMEFDKNIKSNFFISLVKMDLSEFYKKEVGSYISINTNDISAILDDYLVPLVALIEMFFNIFIYFIFIAFTIDFTIAIFILALSIIFSLVPKLMAKLINNKRIIYLNSLEKYTNIFKEFMENKLILNKNRTIHLAEYYEKELDFTLQKRMEYGKCKSASLVLNGFSMDIVNLFVYIYIAYLFMNHSITIGTSVLALSYSSSLIEPIKEIMYDFTAIESTKDIRKKVFDIINVKSNNAIVMKEKFSKLEVENFTKIINNEKYKIPDFSLFRGEKLLLTGKSGSGKSLFLKSMYYDNAFDGRIKYNDKDLKQYDITQTVNYISQESMIFKASYMQNVTLFDSYHYVENDLISFILKDLGFEYIKEKTNCTNFSGGEKQIVALIRALQSKAEIYLFDEAFSAIDYKKRQMLIEKLIQSDLTFILISHDMDIQKYFDKIIKI